MLNIPSEVLDLIFNGGKKNIRIHFPNGERGDILADSLVDEKFSFNDSICSRSELTFGLCEMPFLQFETFGVENVKGATIEAALEVYCPSTVAGSEYKADLGAYIYSIPYGRFVVSECEKQADMTHRRFVCHASVSDRNWTLPEYIAQSLAVPMWETGANIEQNVPFVPKISMEAVIAMLFPDYGRSYTRHTSFYSGTFTSTFTAADGTQYEMTFTTSNYFNPFAALTGKPAVSVCKEHYTPEYLATVAQIRAKKQEIGWIDDLMLGYNKFNEPLFAENVNSSSYRYYGTPAGGIPPVTFDNDGISKAFYPSSDAFIIPFVYIASDENIYPFWKTANGGYFDAVGGMSTLWFTFNPPQSWIRIIGLTLRDITHGVTLYDAQMDAADDYIDFEADAVPLDVGTSGLYTSIGMSISKKTLERAGGTVKRNMVQMAPYNLNTTDWYKWVCAFIELEGKFGHLNRNGVLEIFSLKDRLSGLYPAEDLYPADDLYPSGNEGIEINAASFRSMWYDDEQTLFYGKITAEYDDLTIGAKSTAEVYCDGFDATSDPTTYLTLDVSQNEIIKSRSWYTEDIPPILSNIAANVSGVRFMPARLTMQGRPDLDAGDIIEVQTDEGVIVTINLDRSIEGIQSLVDTITSK